MITPQEHRALAVSLYNKTWELMSAKDRTAQLDDEMLSTAHASAYHWLQVGNDKNFSISHWQLSRVYAILNRPQSALYHGQRALAFAKAGDLSPFYHAYAHEAMARAHLCSGDRQAMLHERDQAVRFVAQLTDPEEMSLIKPDLATLE